MLGNIKQALPTFYKRPMAILSVGLGIGVLAGRFILLPAAAVLALCLALLALLLLYFNKRSVLPSQRLSLPVLPLLLLASALGLLRLQLAYPALPMKTDSCALSGRIADTPQYSRQSWSVELTGAYSDGQPVDGKVLLRIKDAEGTLPLQVGQTVVSAASLSLPTGKRGDTGRDWRFYYFTKGISCLAYSEEGQVSLYAGQLSGYGRLLALRAYTTEALSSMLGEQNGGLAAAMLHGDTAHIPQETLDDFRNAGVSHLLAVSGLHVGLLVGALLFCLRRARAGTKLLLIAMFLTLYCLFTALSPSTLRASLMALCMLAAQAIGRRNDPLSSLCFAFNSIILISPFSLFDVGFQLSFTAVLGILLLQPVLSHAFMRMPEAYRGALCISIAGQVSTLPVTVAYFTRLPVLSILANLLIVPLAALVVLPALISLPFYAFLPSFAYVIASVSGVTLDLMRAVASFVADMGSLSLYPPPLAACAMYFLTLLFLSPFARGQQRAKRLLASLCALVALLFWIAPLLTRMQPRITVLDTQSGYAAHVHTQGKDLLLVDEPGGKDSALQAYLALHGVRRAEMLVGETQTRLQWGGEVVTIGEGYVELRGIRYETAQTGQLTITLRRGRAAIRAYADDVRYAILQRKNRSGG